MVAIIGSGFGLYGYMPALIDFCEQRVVLPRRYFEKWGLRSELNKYGLFIKWVDCDDEALSLADTVVISVNPANQVNWIKKSLKFANIKRMVLEKPLSCDPISALDIFNILIKSEPLVFRIGYNFKFTKWAQDILSNKESLQNIEQINLKWFFMAHHYRNHLQNWKKNNSEGGGALRFYGIHIIALLAELGYTGVNKSNSKNPRSNKDEMPDWEAQFFGPGLPEFNIEINTQSEFSTLFSIQSKSCSASQENNISIFQNDPFSTVESKKIDPKIDPNIDSSIDSRVPILGELCRSLWKCTDKEYVIYYRTIKLWQKAEEILLL